MDQQANLEVLRLAVEMAKAMLAAGRDTAQIALRASTPPGDRRDDVMGLLVTQYYRHLHGLLGSTSGPE